MDEQLTEETMMNSKSSQSSPILRLLLAAGGLVLLVAGLRAAKSIINPFLLALIFAFVFGPVIGWLRKKGVPAFLALLLTILIIFAGSIFLLIFLGVAVSDLVQALPTYESSAQEQTASIQETLANNGINTQSVLQTIDPSKLVGVLGDVVVVVADTVGSTIFMLFVLAFMLFETIGISRKLTMPSLSDNQFVSRFVKFGADIRRYVVVLTWINFLVGLGDAIFLTIMGVDYAVLWGLVAWFMGYIPSVGFWLALIPPVLLAYAEYGATTALIVFLGYVLINGSIQNIVQPKLMGDQLNLSPLVVIASLFIWTWILGPIGALIAVPMTLGVHQLVLARYEGSRWLADLMGAAPPETKPDQSGEAAAGAD